MSKTPKKKFQTTNAWEEHKKQMSGFQHQSMLEGYDDYVAWKAAQSEHDEKSMLDRVNDWHRRSSDFIDEYNRRLGGDPSQYRTDSADWQRMAEERRAQLREEARELAREFTENRGNYSKDTFDLVAQMIREGKKTHNQVVKGAQAETDWFSQFGSAEEYEKWYNTPKKEDGSIDLRAMAQQMADELAAYESSAEYRGSLPYAARNNQQNTGGGNTYGAMASAPQAGAEDQTEEGTKHQELKRMADYYAMMADREDDLALLEADMTAIGRMSAEDQRDLETYVTGRFGSDRSLVDIAAASLGYSVGRDDGGRIAQAQLDAKAAFDRLAAKYGEQAVKNYAESYSRYLNQTMADKMREQGAAGNDTTFGNIAQSAASVAANTAGSFAAPLGAIGSMFHQTGRYSTLDPNNYGMAMNAYAGSVRDTVENRILGEEPTTGNKVWATVYQAGMSALDNLARIAAAGGTEAGALALAGLGSFGQSVAEASANGANPQQAAMLGLISGASEVATEKIGLDKLFRTAEYAPESLGQVIKEALKQSGSEILEEELTFLTGLVAEALILRDRSPYKMRVAELMDGGMSYDEAVSMANQELGQEAWDTALQSALSGFMMSLPASAHAEVTDRQNRPIRNQYAQQAEARLTELGVAEDQVKALAQAVARQHMGYDLSRKDANLIKGSQAAQDVLGEFQESDPLRKLAEEAAAEQAGATAPQEASVQAKTATAETDPTQVKAAQTVTQAAQQTAKAEPEIDESWMDFDVNAPVQTPQAQSPKAAPQETAQQTAPQEDDGGDDAEFFKTMRELDSILEADPDIQAKPSRDARLLSGGKAVQVAGVESTSGGKLTLKLTDGSTAAYSDMAFANAADARVYSTIEEMGISADEANILLERYYLGGVNGVLYAHGIQEAFNYGKSRMTQQDAMTKGSFTRDLLPMQVEAAYQIGFEAGQTERENQRTQRPTRRIGNAIGKKGSVTVKASVKGISKMQKVSIEVLKVLAEATGINIVVDANLPDNANGIYDPATNTMTIDLNAGKDYSGTMLFTAAHELTHMIKAWNPQKFDVLADFLVEQYGKHGKSVADLVAAKKDLYAKNGKTISDELAFEEVIADSMEAMLQDGTVLAKLRQRDQTVWEKIRDYISQLVDKIRKAYGNLKPDSVEGQTVAAWTDVLEQIQDLFVDAVLEAGEIYQGNGADVSKNQAGEVLFSLKRDRQYMDAVNSGDMETAQRMADEAAEAAGYPVRAYHGTNGGNFNEFDWGRTQRADAGWYGRGHYFATRRGEAAMYGKRVIPVALRNPKPFNFETEIYTIYDVDLKHSPSSNVLTSGIAFAVNMAKKFPEIFGNNAFDAYDNVNGGGKKIRWNEIHSMINEFLEDKGLRLIQYDDGHYEWMYNKAGTWRDYFTHNGYETREAALSDKIPAAVGILFGEMYRVDTPLSPEAFYLGGDMEKSDAFSKELIKRGYSGVLQATDGDEIVIFDSENIKDASPVTYDDDGNVIPLSQRFNKSTRDMRFSLRAPVEQVGDLVAVHNLNITTLLKSLRLGGMPMPSVAVIRAGDPHPSYGNVSVVFSRSTVDPESDPRNRIYGNDVFTPTIGQALRSGLSPDASPEEYVKAMLSLGRRGVGQDKEAYSLMSYAAPEYSSIAQAKADIGRLDLVGLEEGLDAVLPAMERAAKVHDELAGADPQQREKVFEAMASAAEQQKRGDGIGEAFREHGISISKEQQDDLDAAFSALSQVPTTFFEAKPERVVRPDEWSLVVVPDNTDPEALEELRKAGLNVKTYQAFREESRVEVINSMPELRFSLRDPGQQKAAAQLQKENQKLREDIAKLKDLLKLQRTVTNGTKFTKTSIEAAAAKLIKDTGAKGTKAELAKLLETFYETIVQQKDPTLETVQEAAAPAAEWLAQHMEQGSVSAAEMMLAEQELIREVYDSYWSVSTLRTFADVKQAQINRLRGEHLKRMADLRAKHRAKVQELKAEHREALQRVKAEDRARLEAKLAEQRAQYQASRKESIESRHRTETRHKIQRVVKQLNDLLLHESKDKHVPERLKKVVAEILDAINMEVTSEGDRRTRFEATLARYDREIAMETDPEKVRRLIEKRRAYEEKGDQFKAKMEALHAAYEQIKDSKDPLMQNVYSEGLAAHLMTLIVEVGDTPLGEMNMHQLECVYDICQMVKSAVQKANKAFKAGKNQTIVQMGEQAQEEIRKAGGEHETSAKLLDGIKGFKWANLKPIYAMRAIGSDTLTKLFQNLRNGEDTWAKDIYEARDFFRQQRDKFHFDKWDFDKTYSFKSTTGKDFKLTLQQIMSLYAYSRRHQADQHLYKGGFVFDSSTEVKKKWNGITYKATVNNADAHNLTPEILADIVSKLTPEQKGFVEAMQSYLSDVMGAKGNEVSMAMYDVRLFKEKNYFPLKSSKLFIYQQTEAAGEIKLKNSGFTKGTKPQAGNPIILQDFMDVWADHVNDMSLYHAMVLPLEDFNRVLNYTGPNTADTKSVSVKTALQNAYGTQAYDYLSQMLKDINGGARADRDAHWINRWTTRFKKGATFASLSVVFQQPSAIARAFAVIDHKYFIGKRIDAKQHKAMWEEVKKYAGVARIKEMGQFDINMGRTTSEFITAKEYGSLTEKAKAMFADSGYRDEVFGRLPALADEVTWVTIWDAVKRETAQRNPGMNTHSEEFLTKAGERFTEVITLTQVYDSVLSRSQMMRSKDTGVKMATAFMAEPTTTVNMLADGILQTKRGNKKYFGKVLGAVVTSNLINSMLAALVYAARDDDEDETYWEKYLSSFVGKFFDSLNPLTYLPLLKDVVSIIQGYDVERSDMALFADIWNAWGKLDNKDYSAWRKVEDFAGSIAKVFGLPIQNIMRDLRGLWQVFAKSLPLAQGTAAGSRYAAKEGIWRWMGGGEVSNQQQLYNAYVSGDMAHAARVAARYKDQSAVNSALKKALRENDPRIHEAALAKIAEDFGLYDELLSQIENEGHFAKRLIAGAVEAEINEILPDKESQSSTREKSYYDAEDFGIAFYHGDQEVIDMVRQDLVDTYVLNGKSLAEAEKAFQGDARSGIKEQYEAGAISDKEAVSGLVQYGGKTKEEAERLVREWRYTAETGHNHGDLKNNFISGRIDRKELISTLMTVNGYSREKATDQADQYEWERDYPELQDRITWTQYKKWRDNGKAGGVNFDTFIRVYDYRKNGGDTREWKEVESYINSLSLTDKQKDALWLSIYESEEKLKTLIWNR